MTAAVSAPPAASVQSATQSAPLTSCLGSNLFGTLLSPTAANTEATMSNNGNTRSSLLKESGLNSNLFILPQSIGNLSEEELSTFFVNATNAETDNFDGKLLLSLTSGTPAAEAIENFLKEKGATQISVSTDSPLSLTTGPDTLGTDVQKMLLVATGLGLTDLQKLKNIISANDQKNALDNQALSDQLKNNLVVENANDISAAAVEAGLVMVMFIAQPLVSSSPKNQDFSFLSGLSSPQISSESTSSPSVNISSKPKGNDPLFSGLMEGNSSTAPFQNDSEKGFQGSIASLGTDTTYKKQASLEKPGSKDINGNLSSFATGFSIAQNSTLSGLNDSSIYLQNSNLLAATISPLINSVTNGTTLAGAAHPAAQAVAIMIEKSASGSEKARQELSVQLDPPELGRLQIQLSLEKGEIMKVHLLAEKQDTLTLLQRDSHVLKSALESAGIQTDSSSLSFDLASGDQSFNQLLGGSQDQSSRHKENHFILHENGSLVNSLPDVTSHMNFIPDAATGNMRYSILA